MAAEYAQSDQFRGARIHLCDLAGLEIRDCEVSGLKIVDCYGSDVYLGGDFTGTRLNELYARNVPIQAVPNLLRAPLEAFRERIGGSWPIPIIVGVWPIRTYDKLLPSV